MSSLACWGQTQRRGVLGSSPTTSPTLPSRPAETDRWARGVHGAVHCNVPLWIAQPPGRPGDVLRQQPPRAIGTTPGSATTQGTWTTRHHDSMRECNVCVASSSSSSKPEPAPCHRGTDDQRRARLDELAEARRSLTRSWPFYAKSSAWMPSLAINNPRRTFLCRGSPARGMVTGASAALPRTYAAGARDRARQESTRQQWRERRR
jgi:hypothetical protein